MALATATKGSSTVVEYFTKMKGLADEMASAGKKLEDDEIAAYILMGLGRSLTRFLLPPQPMLNQSLSRSSNLS